MTSQEETVDRRRWLRPIGVFGRLATYAGLYLLLYIYWPDDISHKPFASLTLADISGQVLAVSIGILLIRALPEPDDDDEIKDRWGWLGVLIVALAVLAVSYAAWEGVGVLIAAMAGLAVFCLLDQIRMAPKRTTPRGRREGWLPAAKREAAKREAEGEAEVRARGRREGWLDD